MGFTESVTEVFVLFKMWSKHICFYIEGRRLVSQIKKAKKTCGWFGSFATTTMARHLAHTLKSSHESRTLDVFFYHLRYNRSLFVVHKEATGISNELWDVKIRRTASTFGSLATCFGFRNTWPSEHLSGTLYMKVIHHMCLYCSAYNQSVFLFRVSE